MTGIFRALCDANVFYPAPLRDLLVCLSIERLFLARWTDRIQDEWTVRLLENRKDLNPERLAKTRKMMTEAILDCVVAGYEPLIESLELPDPDDRHVLAAAIHGQCEIIVTRNLKDFPQAVLEPFGIEAMDPDDFILLLISLDAPAVYKAIKQMREVLRKPPKTVEEHLETLLIQGLTQTVHHLQSVKDRL